MKDMTGKGGFGPGAQISRVLAWVAGAIILFGSSLTISIDVIARLIFGWTPLESFEISGYGLAACIGLGMGYTVSTRANIRVDFLTSRLPTPLRRLFDLLAAIALAAVAVALAWFSWRTLAQSWALDARSISTLQTPIWLPQGIWWFGLFWFAIVAVLAPVSAIWNLIRGNGAAFDSILAPPSLDEEIQQVRMDAEIDA